jgi:hypothetical protein
MTDRVELLPCAFCGGPAVNVADKYITCGSPVFISCVGRQVQADADEWNTRAAPPAVAAPGEGWRPIETSPKDGTRILALHRSRYRGESMIETVWWQPEFEAFIKGAREMVLASGYTFADGTDRRLHSPDIFPATHWLCAIPDMPAPPAVSTAADQHGREG